MTAPWATGSTEVARELPTGLAVGLASGEAAIRLAETGPNDLAAEERRPAGRRLVAQCTNTRSVVLALAAAFTAVIGDVTGTACGGPGILAFCDRAFS